MLKPFDLSLLLLRLCFGGLMALLHGWGKWQTFWGTEAISFPDPMGIGPAASLGLTVFAEFVCALFLVLGLFTRMAALPLFITMLVAVFVIHGVDPLADRETAILYGIPYLVLLLLGGGKYSIDQLIWKPI